MEKLPRMHLVDTAVKFLQNPKVQDSSEKEKSTFLEKKGLTKEEIRIAFDTVGETAVMPAHPVPITSIPASDVSLFGRLREHFVSFLVLGGVTYAVYRFIKTYILPLFFEDPLEKRLKSLEDHSQRHLALVEETMKQLREVVELMREDIRAQNRKIEALSKTRGADDSGLSEIKSGITTLKGLLLNRRQFPPTPVSQPIIPSWQRESPPTALEAPPTSLVATATIREAPPKLDNLSSPLSSPSTTPPELSPKVTSSWVTVDTSPTQRSHNADDTEISFNVTSKSNDDVRNGHVISLNGDSDCAARSGDDVMDDVTDNGAELLSDQ